MSNTMTCRNGHVWEVAAVATAPGGKIKCPVCGAPVAGPAGKAGPAASTSAIAPRAGTGPDGAETVAAKRRQSSATQTFRPQPDSAAARTAPPIPVVPGYEILEELGRGGMGVVYKARQTALQRVVALKMILAGGHAGAAELDRFRAEAETVARLQHPHIVQVFEVGEADGHPFLALEFCAGGSLDRQLAATPRNPAQAARLIETLASAMHVAHRAGVVHRDLKPANVLLAEAGRPKITDFGLAKRLDRVGQTQSGAILGTPAYMAPEQAEGRTREVGPAADVYALGAILYELLTGRPPFRAATPLDTLLQVVNDLPVPPRQLQPDTPHDLETVCLKCLHKDPASRYGSARALAEDLRRFQLGETIRARPAGRAERLWRWCRRNRAVAALEAAVVLSLLAGLLAATYFAVQAGAQAREAELQAAAALAAKEQAEAQAAEARLERARADAHAAETERERELALKEKARADAQAAEASRAGKRAEASARAALTEKERADREAAAAAAAGRQADEEQRRSERRQYVLHLAQAQRFWDEGRTERLLEILEATRPQRTGGRDLRGFEWYYWQHRCQGALLTLRQPSLHSVAYLGDGQRLITADDDLAVVLWDAATGRELKRRPKPAQASEFHRQPVALSPDGQRLAALDDRAGQLHVHDAATGQRSLVLKFGPQEEARVFAFSAGGRYLVAASENDRVKVWDTATGKEIYVLQMDPDMSIMTVALSADGKRLAVAGQDGSLRLINPAIGREVFRLAGHQELIDCLAFSPDGTRLASGSYDRTVRVWNTATGQNVAKLTGHTGWVRCLAFSPGGKLLASGGDDQVARVWDHAKGKETVALRGHTAAIYEVRFRPDGKHLATRATDGTARVWDLAPRPVPAVYQADEMPVYGLAFTPDGRTLAAASQGSDVRLWDPALRQRTPYVKKPLDTVIIVGPDGIERGPDMKPLPVPPPPQPGDAKVLARVPPPAGKNARPPRGADVRCLAMSPDGRWLVTGDADHSVRVFELATGRQVLHLEHPDGEVTGVSFRPDGLRLASAGGAVVQVWDVARGQKVLSFKSAPGKLSRVTYSPDGKRLATAGFASPLQVWDAETGKEVQKLAGNTSHHGIAFSPDGTHLAAASHRVQVWDLAAGKEVLSLTGYRNGALGLAFSTDGRRLAVAGGEGNLRLYDAASGDEVLSLPGSPEAVQCVAMSADGRWLAAGNARGAVMLWEALPRE